MNKQAERVDRVHEVSDRSRTAMAYAGRVQRWEELTTKDTNRNSRCGKKAKHATVAAGPIGIHIAPQERSVGIMVRSLAVLVVIIGGRGCNNNRHGMHTEGSVWTCRWSFSPAHRLRLSCLRCAQWTRAFRARSVRYRVRKSTEPIIARAGINLVR